MTQFTDHAASLPGHDQAARRSPEVFAAMLGGVVAAALGFGILSVLVLFMWITSPFPDTGPDSALRVAAALWLLAHGADLVRTDALSGTAVPVGITPLLLFALPAWLVHRAASHALAPDEDDAPDDAGRVRALGALGTVGWLLGGYLLVAVGVLAYAQHGVLRCGPVSALLNVPLVAVVAAVGGAGSAGGWYTVRPSGMVRRTLTRLALPYGGVGVACRAAAYGLAVLVAGGALLTVGALVWHAGAALTSFTGLTSSLSGRFALLLLTAAVLPNAAVWAGAYALGTGFVVGAGSFVSPAGVHGYPPVLPKFPLLAALPGPTGGPASPWYWLVVAVPVAAGVAFGVRLAGAAVVRGWTAGRTASVTVLGALAHGVLVAAAAAFAGGPLGVGTLSAFGPNGLHAGAAAVGWAALAGLPVAQIGRWWGSREPKLPPPPVETADPEAAAVFARHAATVPAGAGAIRVTAAGTTAAGVAAPRHAKPSAGRGRGATYDPAPGAAGSSGPAG